MTASTTMFGLENWPMYYWHLVSGVTDYDLDAPTLSVGRFDASYLAARCRILHRVAERSGVVTQGTERPAVRQCLIRLGVPLLPKSHAGCPAGNSSCCSRRSRERTCSRPTMAEIENLGQPGSVGPFAFRSRAMPDRIAHQCHHEAKPDLLGASEVELIVLAEQTP